MTPGPSLSRPSNAAGRWGSVAAAVLVSLLLTALAGPTWAAEQDPLATDPFTTELQALIDQLPDLDGADDAAQMRSLVGPPDAFTIAFEEAEDGTIRRREQWFYYDLSTMFEFVDGDLLWDLPLDAEVDVLVHAERYDPAAFRADSTWQTLADVVGDLDAFESVALDPEYEVPATIYVGNLLLLAFDDEGTLFYVETTPLTAGGSA